MFGIKGINAIVAMEVEALCDFLLLTLKTRYSDGAFVAFFIEV